MHTYLVINPVFSIGADLILSLILVKSVNLVKKVHWLVSHFQSIRSYTTKCVCDNSQYGKTRCDQRSLAYSSLVPGSTENPRATRPSVSICKPKLSAEASSIVLLSVCAR